VKFGFSPLIFVRGHLQKIGIAALPVMLRPRHVETFRECRLTDVGESELGKVEIIIIINTCRLE